MFDLCSPELQQKLIPIRDKFKIMDDKKLEDEKVPLYFYSSHLLPADRFSNA
jgi:hypothetical protein